MNALQTPPALHIACTRLTVNVIDDLLRDLRTAVDEVKATSESGKGGMVTMCESCRGVARSRLFQSSMAELTRGWTTLLRVDGLGSSSAIGPGLVGEMAVRCEFSFVLLRAGGETG